MPVQVSSEEKPWVTKNFPWSQRLIEIDVLPDNWNWDFYAPRISPTAIMTTHFVLCELPEKYLSQFEIYPELESGIFITWEPSRISIDINSVGHIRVFYFDKKVAATKKDPCDDTTVLFMDISDAIKHVVNCFQQYKKNNFSLS